MQVWKIVSLKCSVMFKFLLCPSCQTHHRLFKSYCILNSDNNDLPKKSWFHGAGLEPMSRLTTGFHFCALFMTTCPCKSKSVVYRSAGYVNALTWSSQFIVVLVSAAHRSVHSLIILRKHKRLDFKAVSGHSTTDPSFKTVGITVAMR